MSARIIPRGPRWVTRDLGDGERFLDIAGVEPARLLGVDSICTRQAVSLLFKLDRRDLACSIRDHPQVEP